jgi:endonuclease-3
MARKMTKDRVKTLYRRLAAANPAPETELRYSDPFTLLVAVVLSAQATDEGVNKATAALFPIADTPRKMAALGEKKLGEYIKTIGLWRNKAKNVIALSEKIISDHQGKPPRTREALEALPGVGRKTANVVLNVAFGEPTIAVDTHIFRVANRTGLGPGKNPLEVEKALEKTTPPEFLQGAHHWLILHGRYVCKARKPECWRCPIADLCAYKDKTPSPGAAKSQKKKVSRRLASRPKLRARTAGRSGKAKSGSTARP